MKLKNIVNAFIISAVLASGNVNAMDDGARDDGFQRQNRRNLCRDILNCAADSCCEASVVIAVYSITGLGLYSLVKFIKNDFQSATHCHEAVGRPSLEYKRCIDAQGANPYEVHSTGDRFDRRFWHWESTVKNNCMKDIALRKEKDGILHNPEMICIKAREAGVFSPNPIESIDLKPYQYGNTAHIVSQDVNDINLNKDVISSRDLDEAVNKTIANFLQ